MQKSTEEYRRVQKSTKEYSWVQIIAVKCCTLLHSTIYCLTIQYSAEISEQCSAGKNVWGVEFSVQKIIVSYTAIN